VVERVTQMVVESTTLQVEVRQGVGLAFAQQAAVVEGQASSPPLSRRRGS
jgi:hypothetical protein